MTKSSTVQLTIHDLSSGAVEEIRDLKHAFDFENEFPDVYNVLNTLSLDVRQEVLENILRTIPDK